MWGGRGGRGACACGGGGGGGGVILGEVKARPKDIISFSLDYISKSKVQTSNPSSSPIPLDTPARPADSQHMSYELHPEVRCPIGGRFNDVLFPFWEKTQSDHTFQCSTGMASPVLVCVFLSVKDSIWQLPAFQRLDRLRGLGCHRVEVSSEAAGDTGTTKLDIH